MNRHPAVVPPLSKPAWERVEARLLERLAQGEHLLLAGNLAPARPWLRHSLPPLAVAMAMAMAAVIWWQREPKLSTPRNEPASLAVIPEPAAPPAPRQTSHFVTSSAPRRATLGEALVTLASRSELSAVGSDEAGWHVNVERGHVDFEVAPREGRPPFVVQAGETLVTVVGTRFSVVRDGPRARVSVVHGRVQVDCGAHRVSLGAGEQWPDASSTSAPEVSRELAEASPPTGRRGRGPRRAREAVRARASFAQATRLESKKPSAAIAIYRRLARGKGPWAANALYAEARLELERGRALTARARLERYLRSFPDGKNASDVRSILHRLSARGHAR